MYFLQLVSILYLCSQSVLQEQRSQCKSLGYKLQKPELMYHSSGPKTNVNVHALHQSQDQVGSGHDKVSKLWHILQFPWVPARIRLTLQLSRQATKTGFAWAIKGHKASSEVVCTLRSALSLSNCICASLKCCSALCCIMPIFVLKAVSFSRHDLCRFFISVKVDCRPACRRILLVKD